VAGLIGRIFQLLIEFQPVILDQASLDSPNSKEEYQVVNRPFVMASSNSSNSTNSTTNNTVPNLPNLDLNDFDITFGVFDKYPGLKLLFTISGPFKFMQGFLNGT
jgi:hypothetical protein